LQWAVEAAVEAEAEEHLVLALSVEVVALEAVLY
jgi:hypothetical protein